MDKKKLTQEELNALSPRARKAHESGEVISEILTDAFFHGFANGANRMGST